MNATEHPYFQDTKKARRARGEEVEEGTSPANRLQNKIIRHIRDTGGAARRVNVQGRYKEGEMSVDLVGRTRIMKGSWIPSGMEPGYEDIDACKPLQVNGYVVGVKVAVEVKIGRDRLTDAQEKRRDEVLAAGGFYIEAKTFEQFLVEWNAISF